MSPLWISIQTAFTATAVTFLLGIAAALAMSRYRGRARGLLDGILILPLVLPPTVVGFFLLLLFGRRSAVGQALQQIGVTIAFSWPATVIAATVVAFPLMYRTALGAFEQVSPNMLAAARTLGASEWRVFRQVLLPLAWPGVMAGTVLAFARALGEFGATLMLAGNIPGRTQTMPVAIFFAAEGGDMRGAFAWVLWIAALSLATIAAMNYWSKPGRRRRTTVTPEVLEPAVQPRTDPPRPHAELQVDIHKRHADFELSTKFAGSGGTVGVLGESGSGKSMTLRCIAGLERPDAGRIVVNNRVLFDSRANIFLPAAARRIGIVFQDYALFPHLTVRQNIAFGCRLRTVEEWAQLTHLEALLDRYPHELSGGQQQRVALARALAMEPDALLLDEPLSALDPHLRRRMEQQLRELLSSYSGAAVFVTHDRNEAYRLCDELVVMAQGRVEASGPKRDLFDDPGTIGAARVTGCRNLAAFETAGRHTIFVKPWNCTLQLGHPVPEGATHVGIRAHHVQILTAPRGENSFACRVVDIVHSPFEVTLYLDANIEAEMGVDEWGHLSADPRSWFFRLPPERLLLLRP
jgi:molybdate transport system permease protein